MYKMKYLETWADSQEYTKLPALLDEFDKLQKTEGNEVLTVSFSFKVMTPDGEVRKSLSWDKVHKEYFE